MKQWRTVLCLLFFMSALWGLASAAEQALPYPLETKIDARQVWEIFLADLPHVFSGPVAALLMMILVVYYFSPMAWKQLYLYGIGFFFVFSLWSFGGSSIRGLLMQSVEGGSWLFGQGLQYLLPIFLNLMAYEVLDERFRQRSQWVLMSFTVLMVMALFGELANGFGIVACQPAYHALLLVGEVIVCVDLARAAAAGSAYCHTMMIAVAVFTALQLWDGFVLYTHQAAFPMLLTPFSVYAFMPFLLHMLYDQMSGEREFELATNELADVIAAEQERSEIDPLTSCYNRAKYIASVKEAIRRAEQEGQPLSLMIMDIDHFKSFNDTYGHDTGDIVLRNFARTLRSCLDRTRPLFRWGGEEFIVLCHAPLSEAVALADKLRRKIEETDICDQKRVTCSIGVSTWHSGMDHSEDELLQRADDALYRAKGNGRNCVFGESWIFS